MNYIHKKDHKDRLEDFVYEHTIPFQEENIFAVMKKREISVLGYIILEKYKTTPKGLYCSEIRPISSSEIPEIDKIVREYFRPIVEKRAAEYKTPSGDMPITYS